MNPAAEKFMKAMAGSADEVSSMRLAMRWAYADAANIARTNALMDMQDALFCVGWAAANQSDANAIEARAK